MRIPSRRETVLANHPAKSATLDLSTAPIGMSCTSRVLWLQSQAMRPMGVVVVNEDAKHLVEMPTVKIGSQSRHSDRTVRAKRSATPLACGARNGVRTTSIPSL